MKNKKFYQDLDTGEFLTKKGVRNLYFDLEINDIESNLTDYKRDLLDLSKQLDLIRLSQHGDIEVIINNLRTAWAVIIEEIKVKD